jgi:1,4-alpha-glucan branching enzyme
MSDDDGDGIWTIVKPLAPGRYQYKFVIDNALRWEKDPSNPNTATEGGIENSLVIVPEGVSYEYEAVTGTVLSGGTLTRTGGRAQAGGEKQEVELTLDAPFANEVYLSGEFNDWAPSDLAMTKGDDGIWRITVELEPGKDEYKIEVDGTWMEDPENPDVAPDPYGGNNSILTVE